MMQRSAASAPMALLALLACAPVLATDAPAPESTGTDASAPVQAIWKQQEITFYFQSFTTFYSCTGLENKLERIMRELGTYSDVRVRSSDCPSSVARMPRVTLQVIAPVEATPQALAERDKNKSVRELARRVRGKSLEKLDDLDQFPAQWRRVPLSRGKLNLEPGDCELIDELRRKVLPKLAVRIVNDDVQCSPNQLTLGQPRLEVEALVEIPKPDDPAAAVKPEGA
jgi:hypothetical protein